MSPQLQDRTKAFMFSVVAIACCLGCGKSYRAADHPITDHYGETVYLVEYGAAGGKVCRQATDDRIGGTFYWENCEKLTWAQMDKRFDKAQLQAAKDAAAAFEAEVKAAEAK